MKAFLKILLKLLIFSVWLCRKAFAWFLSAALCSVKYVAAAFACLAALCILLALSLDYIVKTAINQYSAYMNIDMKVEDVDVRIFMQTIRLEKISMRNPSGFKDKEAFSADIMELKFDVFNKNRRIKRLRMVSPKFGLEGRHEKRIILPSIHKSNFFIIAKNFLDIWSVDLEELMLGDGKDFLLQFADLEKNAKKLEKIGDIRIDNLVIENGAQDTFEVESLSYHKGQFLMKSMLNKVCGIETSFQEALLDLKNQKIDFSWFKMKNPEGFPAENAAEFKRFSVLLSNINKEGEPIKLQIDKIDVDSPALRMEAKNGGMIDAVGADNNCLEIADRLSVFYGKDFSDLFHEDFEGVESGKEFKLPEIPVHALQIRNARLRCETKDGAKAENIFAQKDFIIFENIHSYIEGIRIELDAMKIDSARQMLELDNLSVKNPVGYPFESAIKFASVSVSTDVREEIIKGEKVVFIDELAVRGLRVRIDSKSGEIFDLISSSNNLFKILDISKSVIARMPMYQELAKRELLDELERPARFIIKNIKFEDCEVFIGPHGGDIAVPMEDFSFANFGAETNGIVLGDLTTVLVESIALKAMDGVEGALADEFGFGICTPFIEAMKFIVRLFM